MAPSGVHRAGRVLPWHAQEPAAWCWADSASVGKPISDRGRLAGEHLRGRRLVREHGIPRDWTTRSRVVQVPGYNVGVKVRHPVPEREQVQLHRVELSLDRSGDPDDIPPVTGGVAVAEFRDLGHVPAFPHHNAVTGEKASTLEAHLREGQLRDRDGMGVVALTERHA